MINAISDFYRPDLPRQILHAQARAPKLMLEGGIPCQMLTFVSYLVSITNLNRDGRLLYSRRKAAEICQVTDRTLDRYLGQLEALGVIARRDRKRSPDGTFFGTAATWCSKWWHDLFLAPTRYSVARALDSTSAPRQSAIKRTNSPEVADPTQCNNNAALTMAFDLKNEIEEVHCSELNNGSGESSKVHCSELSAFPTSTQHTEPHKATTKHQVVNTQCINSALVDKEQDSTRSEPEVNAIHATFASDCTGGSKGIKRLSFFNIEEKKSQSAQAPDFSENPKASNAKGMHLPADLVQLLKPLMLSAKSIRLLMWAAKKTDFDGSKTRLQDAARHAMDRMRSLGLLGDQAGRYLFKCLFSNEDFKAKLAMQNEQSAEENTIRLARLFRESLPERESVERCGRYCLRDGYAVFIQGQSGDGLRPLTLKQMAVMATRCELA